MRKMLSILGMLLGASLFAGSALAAPAGVSVSADLRQTFTAPNSHRVLPSPQAQADALGLKVIYSTFNSDESNLYDCCIAWTLSTTESILGAQQFIAMPFSSKRLAAVRRIQLGLSYFTGLNALAISVAADNNGAPGKTLQSFTVTDIPPGGSCCDVESVSPKLMLLKGGKTYWVVAKATADTWGGWNLDTTNMDGTFAFDAGNGWVITSGTLGAFSVLGL